MIKDCTECPNHLKLDTSCAHAIWMRADNKQYEKKAYEDFINALQPEKNHNEVFAEHCSLNKTKGTQTP